MEKLSKSQKLLKEKIISEYCRKKGWNPKKISPKQLIEIVSHAYKNYNVYFK